MMHQISIVIPAYNEKDAIALTITRLRALAQSQGWKMEIIVVDDGSDDGTGDIARNLGVRLIRNPVNAGYGHSLQRGILIAASEFIAITDADGTYPVEDLPRLMHMMVSGLDMAVGARSGAEYQKGRWKQPARIVFRVISEFVAGRKIPDINSGLRIMRKSAVLPHLSKTCMGFSFTTSITLILILNGYFVDYVPITYEKRIGKSKVRHFRDTLRTVQILTSIIALHNPIKLAIIINTAVVLLAVIFYGVAGVLSYADITYPTIVTLIPTVMFASLPIVFMLGCIAESLRLHHKPSK